MPEQTQVMRQFYRWHARLYDATRWTFLFGRKGIRHALPQSEELVLLEIGCGTGHNLRRLAQQHPGWRLIGVDVSPDMLARAARATAFYSRQVRLFEQPYGDGAFRPPEPPDIILFSYSLTMFNPGWEAAITQAWKDLKPGGHIAVVDFHNTPSGLFCRWMQQNHVRMDGHLLPLLGSRFQPELQVIKPAWMGLWRYFIFVGQKALGED